MIELKNISKKFNNNYIIKDVNVTINKGDVIAIIGPSGSGKSTLLHCINLLNIPTSGQVIFKGTDLTDSKCDIKMFRRKIGTVFQHFNLFNHLTVIENVMKPQLDLLKCSRQEAWDKGMELLRMVGLAEKIYSYPEAISGGQKQRVAIARTLAMDPEVILLDEPTSALDPTMVGEVEYVIRKLAKMGKTMIIVTHEMRFAKEISNRVLYLDEKGIYEDGPTEQIFNNPQKEKTRQFIKRLKCLEIFINSKDADYIGAMNRINEYGIKLGFDKNRIQKMQLLFEELCIQNLMPLLMPEPKIRILLEFDENNNSLSMTVFHKGEKLLGTDKIDSISSKLISAMSKEIILLEIIE